MHKYVLLSFIFFLISVIVAFGHHRQVVKDVLDALKNNNQGYSNTKLIGWVGITIAGYITVHYTTPTNLIDVLTWWLAFVAIALGIVKIGDLIQLRTGQKVTETKSETLIKESSTAVVQDPPPSQTKE